MQALSQHGALSWHDGAKADGAIQLICVPHQTLGICFQEFLEILLSFFYQRL